MSVAGNLATMALPDLLHWMDQAQKTGTLMVHGSLFTKSIVSREGRIVAASSTDPDDHLGQHILRQGQINEEQLRWAIEDRWRSGKLLGQILVEAGWISEEELERVLVQQAEEVIFSLFLSTDGRFEFQEDFLPAKIHVPIDLVVNDVLLTGSTWVDEAELVRGVFVSTASIPVWNGQILPDELEGMDFLSRRIVGLVDGRRSLEMIRAEVHAPAFTVGKTLFHLHERGLIEAQSPGTARKESRADKIHRMLRKASSLMLIGEAEAGWMVLEEVRRIDPGCRELQAMIGRARDEFIHQARLFGLTRKAVPYLLKDPESLLTEALTPDEKVIFTWVNGSWNVETIIRSSSFAEPETLLHLKRLKARGYIGVRNPEASNELSREPHSLLATA